MSLSHVADVPTVVELLERLVKLKALSASKRGELPFAQVSAVPTDNDQRSPDSPCPPPTPVHDLVLF